MGSPAFNLSTASRSALSFMTGDSRTKTCGAAQCPWKGYQVRCCFYVARKQIRFGHSARSVLFAVAGVVTFEGARLEPCALFDERHLYCAGWAVTLLGDDQF